MGGHLSGLGSGIRSWWGGRGHDAVDPHQLQLHHFEAAVIEATDTGDLEMLKSFQEQVCLLFWRGIDLVPAKPPLLHRAVARGHRSIFEYLLHLGLDVDERDSSGMTVLHLTCKLGRNSYLPPLMAKSRDIDRRDVWGRTALAKALIYRNVAAAQMLLERGANPNATDIYGMTPLTTAINYDMMEVVDLLVAHGADINFITHHHGKCFGPPLYLAIYNQNLPILQHLLQLGAATQPRIRDYCFNPNNNNINGVDGSSGNNSNNNSAQTPWNYIGFGNNNNNNVDTNNYPVTTLNPNVQHSDAVSLCMYEMVKHGAEQVINMLSESSLGIQVFQEVLSAHGYPLGPAPDILIRGLLNNTPLNDKFSLLLYKLQICSGSASEDILKRMSFSQSEVNSQAGDGQNGGRGRMRDRERREEAARMAQLLKQAPRLVSSLQNQCRRVVRKALMNSGGRNVVWACGPLQCPPALKTVLLLKDVDKAFSSQRGPLLHVDCDVH